MEGLNRVLAMTLQGTVILALKQALNQASHSAINSNLPAND